MLNVTVPDTDPRGKPIPSYRHNNKAEELIFDRLQLVTNDVMEYYNQQYRDVFFLVLYIF